MLFIPIFDLQQQHTRRLKASIFAFSLYPKANPALVLNQNRKEEIKKVLAADNIAFDFKNDEVTNFETLDLTKKTYLHFFR